MRLMSLLRAVIALALCSATAVVAQEWPSKPIRFVVPYGAGGAPDVLSRLLAQKLSERLGQQVIVDNRPGAGGIIAAENVVNSPPDGYSIFIADTGHFAINVSLYKKLPYDPVRDFVPVIHAVYTPLFLVVGAAQPVQRLQDLLALAKSRPEGVLYGSSGNGSAHHLMMAEIKALTGANLIHVPYKGVAQSVPAVLAGDVVAIFVGLPSIQPHVKSGKARIIAVNKHTSLMPDIPSVAESGVPDFEGEVSIGLLAPAGTPADIVKKLNTEVNAVLNQPDVEQRLRGLGIVKIGGTPEQLGEAIRADIQRYAKIVRDSGAKVE